MVVYSAWYLLYPMNEEYIAAKDTQLIVRTRYVLTAGDEELFGFLQSRGDTLLEGVGAHNTDTIAAEWTRRYNWLPYAGNTLAVEAFDSASITQLKHDAIMQLLRDEAQHVKKSIANAKEERADVDYYLKTHTVIDNGFDIVARYSKVLAANTDSLGRVQKLIDKALKGKTLAIHMERRYYLKRDSGEVECTILDKDSVLLLNADIGSGFRPLDRVLSHQTAVSRLIARRPKTENALLAHIDSLGTYEGERDSLRNPCGYGRFLSLEGVFYEGEWKDGKRNGVGFAIVPGQRLRMGEWKEDKFLGERIEYTPDRIYGIDISRYQHERQVMKRKGRRKRMVTERLPFNWKNLRITSLGTQSKKTIRGVVDYPVRFIYIKATEGMSVTNRYFMSDYANSRKYGYRTGAYHFYSILSPAAQQASFFLRNSRYAKGDLPPVLDLEPTDAQIKKAGGIRKVLDGARTWMKIVEKQLQVKPILYVSQRFVNKYLPLAPDLKKNYEVWIARYGEYKPDVNLVYWQLSQDGRVNGIQTTVDINVFNGFNF